jgi:hypothetical protein
MPRVKIVLSENGQNMELELESPDETIDELNLRMLKLVGGLGDWLDKKDGKGV